MTEKMMILLLLVMRVRISLLVGISHRKRGGDVILLGRNNSPRLVISQSHLGS